MKKILVRMNKFPEEDGFSEVPEKFVYDTVEDIIKKSLMEFKTPSVQDYNTEKLSRVLSNILADANLRGRISTYNFLPDVDIVPPQIDNSILLNNKEKAFDDIKNAYSSVAEPKSGWGAWKNSIINKGRQLAGNTVDFLRGFVFSEVGKGVGSGLRFKEVENYILKLPVSNVYMDSVLDTNILKSFNHGKVSVADLYEFVGGWKFVSMNDSKTRPSHRALHGMCADKRHIVWQYYFPPLGYNCRCVVIAVSKKDIKEYKTNVPIPPPYTRDGIGPDYDFFGFHPGDFYGIE